MAVRRRRVLLAGDAPAAGRRRQTRGEPGAAARQGRGADLYRSGGRRQHAARKRRSPDQRRVRRRGDAMSSAAALLPAVPRPPHDPLTILLDNKVGWPIAGTPDKIEISPVDQALVLTHPPGTARPLASPDGTFGGLTPPDNVAIGPECIVLLLDRTSVRLKRFDPCDCAFVPVPCIAGPGKGSRQFDDPGGIVAACGNLYICDANNQRVQV